MTPTQRTLKYYRDSGYKIGNVERYVAYAPKDSRRRFKPGQKFDLFGIIDMVAIKPGEILGIQSTGSAFAAHWKKLTIEKRKDSIDWIQSGAKLILIGWRKIKIKQGGIAMIWSPRIKEITLSDLEFKNNRYTDNNNGTIIDRTTGLMWQKAGSDDRVALKNVPSCIEKLNQDQFAGHNDWRLPTLDELKTLLEPERKQPDGLYIDPMFEKKQEWCWSSELRPGGDAWGVSFLDGYVSWSYGDFYYVRAVRSGQ